MVQQQENMEKKLIQAPNTFNIGVASLKGIGSQVPVLWQLWFVSYLSNTSVAFPESNTPSV